MKYLYSDTQDYVDPEYDFLKDESKPGRRRYWDDRYAHELMSETPYDGLLMSMSAIKSAKGVASSKGRYSVAEEQRLLRVGARKFLRFDGERHRDKMLMGDCGAFAYANHPKPAYTPEEVVDFYADAGFTHGCHPDHIIFDFLTDNPSRAEMERRAREQAAPRLQPAAQGLLTFDAEADDDPDDLGTEEAPDAALSLMADERAGSPATVVQRYDITMANAEEFLKLNRAEGRPFEPLGVVQGWSPASMAEAARTLEAMGYRYLAIGGMVPLRTPEIHLAMRAIREAIRPETNIHLLGFAKADHIHEFTGYGITSFDSTSPLIRAFMDATRNYYLPGAEGKLEYYSAIRVPQAIENSRLMQAIKRGLFDANTLQRQEQVALDALRRFDRGEMPLGETLDRVASYHHCLTVASIDDPVKQEKQAAKSRQLIEATLRAAPWKRCGCSICKSIGVEVIIFRSANRNRRRGFHNLGVYREHVHNILASQA